MWGADYEGSDRLREQRGRLRASRAGGGREGELLQSSGPRPLLGGLAAAAVTLTPLLPEPPKAAELAAPWCSQNLFPPPPSVSHCTLQCPGLTDSSRRGEAAGLRLHTVVSWNRMHTARGQMTRTVVHLDFSALCP